MLLLLLGFAASCGRPAEPPRGVDLPATRGVTAGAASGARGAYTLAGLRGQDADAGGVRHADMAVLVSFFNGRMTVAQHCFVFRDGAAGAIRYVWNWATQGGGPQAALRGVRMPEAQRAVLDAALRALPPDQPFARDADALVVGWEDGGGRWRERTYDRTRLPPEVRALCELVGVPLTWL